MDFLTTVVLPALVVILFILAVQHMRRYDDVHYVQGIDMRGIDEVKGFKKKILWIKAQPSYTVCKDPYKILLQWEQKAKVLDNKS